MHNDEYNLSQQVSTTINNAGELAFLTDATVAAADTKAGLVTAINTAAVGMHHDLRKMALNLTRVLNFNANITDANILALTTVAGLAALTGVYLPGNFATLI
jgi:hypothetical protein